jgi:hypothetical protein
VEVERQKTAALREICEAKQREVLFLDAAQALTRRKVVAVVDSALRAVEAGRPLVEEADEIEAALEDAARRAEAAMRRPA